MSNDDKIYPSGIFPFGTFWEVQCIECGAHFESLGPESYSPGDHVGYECPECGEEEVIVICKAGEL